MVALFNLLPHGLTTLAAQVYSAQLALLRSRLHLSISERGLQAIGLLLNIDIMVIKITDKQTPPFLSILLDRKSLLRGQRLPLPAQLRLRLVAR